MMTVVDLSSFADAKFDPKLWVNEACRSRHPEHPIDKHLTDLETKLQLISENIASSLEEQSSASLLKVPRASREIIRLREDAVSLRSTVSVILTKLKQAEGSCAESVAALARVDVVKQRMEAAYGTLQDAAGLAQLSASVETVFASGDLARAADTLANMRRCLSVIGEVPEFSNVWQQLEILEDRLEGMVLPKLSEAVLQRKVESAQSLHDILATIGHYSSFEKQYTRVRLKPLRRVWEDCDSGKGGLTFNKLPIEEKPSAENRQASSLTLTNSDSQTSFIDWLPHFYDEVLLSLEQEWKWCGVAFPDKYKSLVPNLLVETMASISTSFNLRVESSSFEMLSTPGPAVDGQKAEKLQHTQLGLLINLHNITGTFARNIQHLFDSIEGEDMVKVLKAIYSPYEGYKERYGDLELSLLSSQVMSLDFRGAVSRSVGARGVEVSETVRRMEASIPAVALFLESAVDRCLNFTGGSEAEALLQTLDEVMRLFIVKLQDMLKSLRAICAVDRDSNKRDVSIEGAAVKKEVSVLDMVSDEEEWAIVQGVLQILAVAESLSSRTAVFEATLCATLKRLCKHLSLQKLLTSINQATAFGGKSLPATGVLTGGSGASFSFDMALLRLFDKPDKARRLNTLLEQMNDTGFHVLAHTSGRVASFNDLVNDLVYDVLIAKVRARLNNVALLPVWSAEKEENAFDLPSFSAYASPHVTSMGEYLLTLPQQLEPVMVGGGRGEQALETGEENVDDSQLLATEWMFKVAEGSTSLYTDQLRGIQFLSDQGAQQLSADIDYLSKVLSALSMHVPPVLVTFQACLQVPKEKLAEFIKSESSKQLDMATAKLICKMRKVSTD